MLGLPRLQAGFWAGSLLSSASVAGKKALLSKACWVCLLGMLAGYAEWL